jgi:poly(3-hydroxybutyrate) depolymerase
VIGLAFKGFRTFCVPMRSGEIMRFAVLRSASLLAVFLLAACGGGGDGGTTPPPIPKETIKVTQEKLATPVQGASNYLLYLPQGYGDDASRKWPLIVFLHGSQPFSNLALESLSTQGVMGHMKEVGKGLPAIVVQTQQDVNQHGHKVDWHDPVFVDAVIREVEQRYAVDKTRVSITGGSLGGFGSWGMVLAYPNRFAAVMPVVGGLSNDTDSYDRRLPITTAADWGGSFARIITTPMRVYAGIPDANVPIAWARNPVAILRAAGGSPDMHETNKGHGDTQSEAFAAEPIGWMLAQARPDASEDTSPITAADYVGSYRTADNTAVDVSISGDRMTLTFSSQRAPMSFLPIGDDRFIAEWMMRAKRDAQGQVKCFVTPMLMLPDLIRDGATEACN